MHFTIASPLKKDKDWPMRRRPPQSPAQLVFTRASMCKNTLKKLGFGFGQNLTIIVVKTQI
jgi:hypothetical protein